MAHFLDIWTIWWFFKKFNGDYHRTPQFHPTYIKSVYASFCHNVYFNVAAVSFKIAKKWK